ncbi:MAG: cbb3-type cytochrome c oxidase subunit I [Acidobacteriota bacterium]
MAIISELIPTFSRKPIFGYRFIGYSSVAIALFGFIVWGHHMFVSGQSRLVTMIFSALTFSVAIPSAVKIFNWLATMYKGNIVCATPMWYALSFMFLFTIGGTHRLALRHAGRRRALARHHFIVAHFHYVMVGGTVVAFLGGLHYWWPKMTGRMLQRNARQDRLSVRFLGFQSDVLHAIHPWPAGHAAPLLQLRPPSSDGTHMVSSIGSYIMAIGLFLTLGYLLHSLKNGRVAPANPGAATHSNGTRHPPPPHDNFAEVPVLGVPVRRLEVGRGYRRLLQEAGGVRR